MLDLNALDANYKSERRATPLLEPGGAADPILRKIHNLDLDEDALKFGPRFEPEDIRCSPVAGLGQHTSGVLCKNLLYKLKEFYSQRFIFQYLVLIKGCVRVCIYNVIGP